MILENEKFKYIPKSQNISKRVKKLGVDKHTLISLIKSEIKRK